MTFNKNKIRDKRKGRNKNPIQFLGFPLTTDIKRLKNFRFKDLFKKLNFQSEIYCSENLMVGGQFTLIILFIFLLFLIKMTNKKIKLSRLNQN